MDGSSGLAKLSCTPAQHTGMSVSLSSVGVSLTTGGTGGYDGEERMFRCEQLIVAHTTDQKLTRDSEQC